MQPRTSFVSQLDSSDALVGSVLQSASPTVAEALGYTPLDFLFVDRQHGEPMLEN